MAYYKSGQIYATQNSNVAIQTASGSIASFETPLQMPIVGCKININPVQSGIGTPTPDNPRAISGRTQVLVTKTGKNIANFEAYKGETKTISLGQTVYGGTLDLLTGKLVIDYNIITLTGGKGETWNAYSNGNGFYIVISDMHTGTHMNGWCNRFVIGEDRETMCVILGAATINNRAYFAQANNIDGVTSLATWKEWLSNNNVQLVYPRKKPIEVTLTPETFKTFVGTNNFYADCGDVEVKYKNIITGG